MKKVLMSLSLLIACSNTYGVEIDLGQKNIYSETGFETSLRNTTSIPYIIDSKKIEERKYTSISDILNDSSIVQGRDIRGQGSEKAKATVQLLVDGVPANFLDTSHIKTPIEMVNVNDVARIEVIPGGGAVLYGSGTSGGVINIITKRHKGTHGNIGYRFGSYNSHIFNTGIGTSVGPVDLSVSYSKNKTNGYRRDNNTSDADYFSGKATYNINSTDYATIQYNGYRNDYKSPNMLTKEQINDDRRQSGVAKTTDEKSKNKKNEVTFIYNNKINDNYTLNFLAFYQDSKRTGSEFKDTTGMYKGILSKRLKGIYRGAENTSLPENIRMKLRDDYWKTVEELHSPNSDKQMLGRKLGMIKSQLLDPNKLNKLRPKIGKVHQELADETPVFSQSNSLFGDKKIGFKLKNKFKYGKDNSFILGLGYTHNHMVRKSKFDIINKMPIYNFDLAFDKNTYELFGMNTYKYNEFEFTQGLRIERANYKGYRANLTASSKKYSIKDSKNNFAANLGVNYLYSNTGNIYAKYERSFTSPAPAQMMDKVLKNGVADYVLNNLKSEKTNLFEIGWNDYLLNSLVSADIYFSETKDEIKTVFQGGHANPNSTFKTFNIGKTRRFGFDLKAEQTFEKFSLRESYSYVNAKIKRADKKNKETEGKYLSYVPAHKFVLGVDYQPIEKLTLGLDAQYTAKYYINDKNTYNKDGEKLVFNLRANYKINENLDVYAGINNLFNKKYYNSVSTNYTGDKVYDPAPTRNYYAGFNYKF